MKGVVQPMKNRKQRWAAILMLMMLTGSGFSPAAAEEPAEEAKESAEAADKTEAADPESPDDAEVQEDMDISVEIDEIQREIENRIMSYEGDWSVYLKVLNTDDEILLNEMEMTSASLIKLFVMSKTFRDQEAVLEHLAKQMGEEPDSPNVTVRFDDLMRNMIAASDNESFNELVRLQTEDYDFLQGARAVNRFLLSQGYENTSVQGSLYPSETDPVTLGGSNHTTVKDCGLLLDRIYWGKCVDQHTSQQMLNLLFAQETDYKIPAGLPEDTLAASKSGETDSNQHDAAIVIGKDHNYILCIMSQNCPEQEAIGHIRELSEEVFSVLNPE